MCLMCVSVRGGGRAVRECARAFVCVCVCVREREREKERESFLFGLIGVVGFVTCFIDVLYSNNKACVYSEWCSKHTMNCCCCCCCLGGLFVCSSVPRCDGSRSKESLTWWKLTSLL